MNNIEYPKPLDAYARSTDTYHRGDTVQVVVPLAHQQQGNVTVLFREQGDERYCCKGEDGHTDTYFVAQLRKLEAG